MRKYFYFRDVTNEDADDDISASIAIPVDSIAGIVPVAITTLELYLKKNRLVNDQKVTLTVTAGQEEAVVQALCGFASSRVGYGRMIIADDANSEYCHSGITACGAITTDIAA